MIQKLIFLLFFDYHNGSLTRIDPSQHPKTQIKSWRCQNRRKRQPEKKSQSRQQNHGTDFCIQAGNDKVVKNIVKKVGAHPLGVDEINFFRDDNTILHFKSPEAYASIQNNTFIVSGEPETKTIKDLLPDIIQQLGPKQSKLLESLVTSSGAEGGEEAPDLVEDKPASTA